VDAENGGGTKLTVVVADDSPTLRKIVGSVLERDGFRVVTADDGVQAVQTIFATQPDAVILDVQMPRVSGYVAARVLKDDWQTADIPVVLLTALDAATDRYWGRLVGAERFLSKNFEAPQLVDAVRDIIRRADEARSGRPRLVPDPVELTDDDVFARVCDLLDRKLFEAQVQTEVTSIASEIVGFEESIAAVLGVLGRVVDYDLAAVLMLDDRSTYVTLAKETSHQQYSEFFASVADAAGQVTGQHVAVSDLVPRVADPSGMLGAEDEGGMATFLSMPLKAHGRIIGVLGLSSATKNAFGETSLNTLRLVESPAALVIENARLTAGGVPS
jgi:DNA-binding response OmpR family regulator